MEKWGLGYEEALKERYPRLIYCRITGFGTDGPLGGIPGYDAVAQALSGMMSINGTEETGPTRVGMPMADLGAGLIALYAIMMAAYEREKLGKGQSIEVALYDAAFSLLHPFNSNFFASGKRPKRVGNQHPNICPYDVYQTGTCAVFLGVGNDRQFRRMCEMMGKPDLADDPRFGTNAERSVNRDALTVELVALFAETDGEAISAGSPPSACPAARCRRFPRSANTPTRNTGRCSSKRMAIAASESRQSSAARRAACSASRPTSPSTTARCSPSSAIRKLRSRDSWSRAW